MKRLLERFKKDLKPGGIAKLHFVKSEWENFDPPYKTSWGFIVWRAIYAFYCIFGAVYSDWEHIPDKYWFIYLTHWNILIQIIYGFLYLANISAYRYRIGKIVKTQEDETELHKVTSVSYNSSPRGSKIQTSVAKTVEDNPSAERKIHKSATDLPTKNNQGLNGVDSQKVILKTESGFLRENSLLESVIWILFSLVGVIPLFVCVAFWTLVYKPGKFVLLNSLYLHGINGVLSVLDTMIVAIPVRLSHVIYLVAFILAYGSFSGLYELAGGTYPDGDPYIYSVLNWREQPRLTVGIVVGLSIGAIVLYFFILPVQYVCRLYMVCRCTRRGTAVFEFHRYHLTNCASCISVPPSGNEAVAIADENGRGSSERNTASATSS